LCSRGRNSLARNFKFGIGCARRGYRSINLLP
jgi:hypothetical protein